MYSKILVAYDGSPQANKALEQSVQLALKLSPSRLEVVHVVSYPSLIIGEAYFTGTASMRESILEESEQIAARASAALKDLPIPSQVHLLEGRPADCIVEFAEEYHCNLIVIGSHGYTGLKEFVLGSVSHNVVQYSKVPVLVVK
jgi:nucleotide-binding universal stress UspA family protein